MNKLRLLIPLTLAACLVTGLLLALQPQRASAVTPNPPVPEWYFKPSYLDYAPNGVPDFDQKQDNWGHLDQAGLPVWTFCGPVAAANSLWWFDSKFESNPIPPPLPNDHYYLVTSYNQGMDDHWYMNVGGWPIPQSFLPGLIDDLACYFKTDQWPPFLGTEVHQMAIGLQEYLYNDPNHPCNQILNHSKGGSYYDDYHVQLVQRPTWEWVVSEVKRSEDVILLLGFWQQPPTGGPWMRVGGHYVTVSGVDESTPQIAISDPFFDMAEMQAPGQVFSGTLIPHSFPHTGPAGAFMHNDAGNISRDYYSVNLFPVSPFGLWEISNYPVFLTNQNFIGQNCPDEFSQLCIDYYNDLWPVFVEVEYAIAVSPFYWKAGGEWVSLPAHGQWGTEWWWYKDDADSCLPDFSYAFGDSTLAYLDGPTALANSLWWFDSKAETLLTGGFPEEPPTITDTYDLVQSYDPRWDDHDPQNTQPLIEAISETLSTTVQGTDAVHMLEGIKRYLDERGDVGLDFYIEHTAWPTWDWLTHEVRTSEDVLMLLGFYEITNTVKRVGGHWVNAAGVGGNSEEPWVGLSDSQVDNANHVSMASSLYLGRVYPITHTLGTAFTPAEKLEPQSISHDIYKVVDNPVALPSMALDQYPAESFFDVYFGLNGDSYPWTRGPISTVVEYAIGVSPYSDLAITKTVPITTVGSGGNVTYTIAYSNQGLAAVNKLCISDTIPSLLSNVGYNAKPLGVAGDGVTCTWKVPLLSYGAGGLITVTGISSVSVPPFNEACITGTTSIGNPTPDRNEDNNCDDAGWYTLYLPAIFR